MLSKESKIKVLEGFYGLDYIFFGKELTSVVNCCPVVKEEFVSIKGALLSVYIEMLKLMKHSPETLEEKIDSKNLKANSKQIAREAREASSAVVQTEQSRNDIKAALKEAMANDKNVNINQIIESRIREKAFRLAVDNMLVARALTEAQDLEALNDWSGKIVEDSYKILRDSLCETAMLILDDEELK